jgi:hypothetical protein
LEVERGGDEPLHWSAVYGAFDGCGVSHRVAAISGL